MKYSKIVKRFTNTITPTLSGIYHADEIFVNCKGQQEYFWDMVDKGTRFLVSTHYSTKRNSFNARMLFKKAKHRPLTVFTDGLQGYRKAFRETWGTRYKKDHVKCIRLKADKDKRNNIIERIQGTIRERIKTIRGFKRSWSAELMLNLFCIWYNFIRVHQGIKQTPAQRANIELSFQQNK